jgi:hypothetical protein
MWTASFISLGTGELIISGSIASGLPGTPFWYNLGLVLSG